MTHINLTIPGLYTNQKLNQVLIEVIRSLPERYLYYPEPDITIYGNIPQSVLSGSRSITSFNVPTYSEMAKLITSYSNMTVKLRFDCSSVLFDDSTKIPIDRYTETLLELSDNGSNQIEVSSLAMKNHLESTFKNSRFVASKYTLSDFDQFERVVTFPNLASELTIPKYKTELILDSPCATCNSEVFGKCVVAEHDRIVTFEPSYMQRCSNFNVDIHLMPEFKLEDYVAQGYTKFQVEYWGNHIPRQVESVIRTLVRPEYLDEVRLLTLLKLDWR